VRGLELDQALRDVDGGAWSLLRILADDRAVRGMWIDEQMWNGLKAQAEFMLESVEMVDGWESTRWMTR